MLTSDEERQVVASSSPEMLDALQERIIRERAVYGSSEDGVSELCRIILSSGIFDKIDPKDEASVGGRNFVIDLMDSMGLFTENNLPLLVATMLSSPVPFMYEKRTETSDGQ